MEETLVVPDTLETPIEELAPVPELPELRYEFQPTDESGRNLGGKQVIKYRTSEELAEKLRDQNVELVRRLREVTRRHRLGISDEETVPEDAERTEVKLVEKKPLSIEERYAISQELNDPEKFEAARDRLLASAGYDELRQTVEQLQLSQRQIDARTNAQIFFEKHPTFYVCEENLGTIVQWMTKNKLGPSVLNFELAYKTMQEAGLLLPSPIVREDISVPVIPVPEPSEPSPADSTKTGPETIVPNTQALVDSTTRISSTEQPQEKRQHRAPSGLNSRIASNAGVLPVTKTLTLADVDRMPSEDYRKRIMTDPEFVKTVNELEATRPPRPRRS